MEPDPVRDLLAALVVARQRRLDRAAGAGSGAISADDLDLLTIDVLNARLDLARYDQTKEPA